MELVAKKPNPELLVEDDTVEVGAKEPKPVDVVEPKPVDEALSPAEDPKFPKPLEGAAEDSDAKLAVVVEVMVEVVVVVLKTDDEETSDLVAAAPKVPPAAAAKEKLEPVPASAEEVSLEVAGANEKEETVLPVDADGANENDEIVELEASVAAAGVKEKEELEPPVDADGAKDNDDVVELEVSLVAAGAKEKDELEPPVDADGAKEKEDDVSVTAVVLSPDDAAVANEGAADGAKEKEPSVDGLAANERELAEVGAAETADANEVEAAGSESFEDCPAAEANEKVLPDEVVPNKLVLETDEVKEKESLDGVVVNAVEEAAEANEKPPLDSVDDGWPKVLVAVEGAKENPPPLAAALNEPTPPDEAAAGGKLAAAGALPRRRKAVPGGGKGFSGLMKDGGEVSCSSTNENTHKRPSEDRTTTAGHGGSVGAAALAAPSAPSSPSSSLP